MAAWTSQYFLGTTVFLEDRRHLFVIQPILGEMHEGERTSLLRLGVMLPVVAKRCPLTAHSLPQPILLVGNVLERGPRCTLPCTHPVPTL